MTSSDLEKSRNHKTVRTLLDINVYYLNLPVIKRMNTIVNSKKKVFFLISILNVAKSHCCAKLFSLIISFQTLKIIINFFWTIQFNNRVKLHVQDFHNLSIVKICLYYLWFIFQLIYFRHFLAVLWFWCIFVATVLKSISPFEENKLYTITLKIIFLCRQIQTSKFPSTVFTEI